MPYTANVVPVMWGDTEPEGIAWSASPYQYTKPARFAFDNGPGTYWLCAALPQYLRYKFATPKKITKVALNGNTANGNGSTAFRIEATNVPQGHPVSGELFPHDYTPSEWTVLADISGLSGNNYWNSAPLLKEFEFANTQEYLYYQVVPYDRTPGDWVSFSAFEMYESIAENLTTLQRWAGMLKNTIKTVSGFATADVKEWH